MSWRCSGACPLGLDNMMILRLVRRPDGIDPGSARHPIMAAGSTIGRAPECDVVLDDPLRLVSRRHACLAPHGADAALVRCISASATILVNGDALPPGGERIVRSGDSLRIGGFEVQLEASEPASVQPSATVQREAAGMVAAPTPTVALPHRSRLDQWFDLDHVADPLGPGSPLPSLDRGDQAAGAEAKALTAAALRTPAVEPDERRPRARRSVDLPLVSAATVSAPATQQQDALRKAFLRGAGLDAATPFSVDPATIEHLGALLRTTTEGTLALLRSRALTKRNLRAEGTQIVARENNPLKFAPDAAQALAMLVSAHSRAGFLGPVDALHDAYSDLQVHQLAIFAGMRAAVFDLISRLGPEAIEASEGPTHGLAQRFPALRDAALWRRHKQAHERLLSNLDDVFEAAFGREFLLAYQAQSRLGADAAAPDSHTAGY